MRTAARAATFLEKVKVHRGEPANKGADILAEKAISDLNKGRVDCSGNQERVVPAELEQRFHQETPCRKAQAIKVIYQDRHSTFDTSVKDAIQSMTLREAAENNVPKHEEKPTGTWRQISTLR